MFCVAMKQNWDLSALLDQRYVWRTKNEAYAEKNPLPTLKALVVLGDALGLLCNLLHWKPVACGRRNEFVEVSGNPRRNPR